MKSVISILLAATFPSFAQIGSAVRAPDPNAEALVVCSQDLHSSPEFTPYGFARATLTSLWYARNGAERGNEITKAAKATDNAFSLFTAMMRITKTSTNDFICAKRSLRPFVTKENDENVRTAADFLLVVYDAHISINERLIELIKKLGSTDVPALMDEISTLQVERGQRWADLVQPTSLALMMMVDLKRTDVPGKTTRLVVTRVQKQTLLNWIGEHFPEFKNGTPKDKWSDPAKTAQMYFKVFDGRKCADE